MEVRIGVSQVAKELEIDLGDGADGEKLTSLVEDALAKGEGMFWLSDKKGRRIGVPVTKLGYIDIGPGEETHRVGFGGPSAASVASKAKK